MEAFFTDVHERAGFLICLPTMVYKDRGWPGSGYEAAVYGRVPSANYYTDQDKTEKYKLGSYHLTSVKGLPKIVNLFVKTYPRSAVSCKERELFKSLVVRFRHANPHGTLYFERQDTLDYIEILTDLGEDYQIITYEGDIPVASFSRHAILNVELSSADFVLYQ